MEITQIRRINTQYLAASVGGINAFAEKLGKSQPQMSGLIGKRPIKNIGNNIARDIEAGFNKPKGWLDNVHLGITGERAEINQENNEAVLATEDLTAEAVEFARLWQNLPSDQRAVLSDTAKAFMDSTKKPTRKKNTR